MSPDRLQAIVSHLQQGTQNAYLAMFGAVAIATAVRLGVQPFVHGAQFPTFFMAVILSTFIGGLRVGLASVALTMLAAWYFILQPQYSFALADSGEAYSLATFAIVATIMALTVASLQAVAHALEQANHREALLQARAAAAEQLQRWEEVFENIGFGVSVVDPKSNVILFGNDALGELHGVSADRLRGQSWLDFYSATERDRVARLCEASDRTGTIDYEAERRRTDGSIFPARMHQTSVRLPSGEVRYRIVTVSDITAERELTAELHQAQRLEAIGQLTAGVAHDFNNLLQGIIANLELLDDDIQDRPAPRQLLATIIGIAERCADLTRHLLSFSRQQLLRPQVLDLRTFFSEFQMTLSRTLDPRIRIAMVADADLPPVWVDATHLHTALLNLAINARDAMPSGGHLRIEASTDAADPASPVAVRVTDTGSGIAPELLAKVCEPFFTTKGLNGSGLGLSMVYGFAQQSGGDLRITSEPGQGTCVRLSLPRAPQTPSTTPTAG